MVSPETSRYATFGVTVQMRLENTCSKLGGLFGVPRCTNAMQYDVFFLVFDAAVGSCRVVKDFMFDNAHVARLLWFAMFFVL
mmetsp:Transcript_46623/g.56427  ORF Transcript_46623/g.56427 Transcript_46623/m.56427 type:complete len:82 (+) Transcript_46623:744-989(+)